MTSWHLSIFRALLLSSHPSFGWIKKYELLEVTYFIPRGEEKLQPWCSNHGNRKGSEDHVPRPKQGKLDVPWHFFILLSRERGQENGCSHFFPVHPSLQLHLPQLHWPWPAGEREGKNKMHESTSHKMLLSSKRSRQINCFASFYALIAFWFMGKICAKCMTGRKDECVHAPNFIASCTESSSSVAYINILLCVAFGK